MKKLILLLFCTYFTMSLTAQTATRYVDSVFAGVTKTTAIYGSNFTALTLAVPTIAHTSRQPLVADIYQPTGDTVSRRPVMIYIPTGNFLPKSARSSPTGDRADSTGVEMCTRFAKRGYVTMSIDYRQGWNPIASTATERTFTLINASYRGIQDVRTAIRYMKLNAAALKLDTNRIMLIGEGTGGYLSLGAATLDKYLKIVQTALPQGKFTTLVNGTVTPMVIEAFNGDIEGKTQAIWPGVAGISIPAGDTMCVPNHVGPTSKFHLAVNMGGALGDYTWLDANSTPIISIACPNDENAPYRDGTLLVPIGNGQALPVVQVQGSHWVSLRADSLKVNGAFTKLKPANDPYKALVAPRNAATYTVGTIPTTYGNTYASGLLPLLGRSNADGAPWQWWNTDTTKQVYGNNAAALAGNPGMSEAKARLYIDSSMAFIIPRACVALQLPCASLVSSTEELLQANATKLSVAPNPATNMVTFESEVFNPIQAIELYDMSGRLMLQKREINSNRFELDRGSLSNGMYIAKVKFEGGILSKKIVFEKQ